MEKKSSKLLTHLNSEVFSELESKSWGKALKGGWPEIPNAQSWNLLWGTSHPIPEWLFLLQRQKIHPSASATENEPKERGCRRCPFSLSFKESQPGGAYEPSSAWNSGGFPKSKEFNFCQMVSFPTLDRDSPRDGESPLDTFKYTKQRREDKVTERT